MESIAVTTEKMIDYLKSFNYIEKKFCISLEKHKSEELELMTALINREILEQTGKLKKIPPSYIAHGVKTLYNLDADCQNDSMVIFDCVYKKIINEYLAIPGLESLFDEHFYDFEWDMHMEYDFSEMSHSYYRDHVEHQVRNMYMMLELLDKFHFMNVLKSFHSDPSLNKIANYVYIKQHTLIEKQYISEKDKKLMKKCAQFYFTEQFNKIFDELFNEYLKTNEVFYPFHFCVDVWEKFKKKSGIDFNIASNHFIYKQLDDDYMEYIKGLSLPDTIPFDSIKKNDISKMKKSGLIIRRNYKNPLIKDKLCELYIRHYSLEYIIRSACIICTLFHDISYPLCHFNTIRKRVSTYIPSMNLFINNRAADIDRVISILKPSLLFNVVSEEEIRKLLSNQDEKWDHGVYSAITLLLTFYESGRINQLSADKQAAIEIAAIAIYNHNFKYNIVSMREGKYSDNLLYYHPVFSLNPISFLLKLCDDLQEWDRKYFEFSTTEPLIFCQNCLSPILHGKYYKIVPETARIQNDNEKIILDKYKGYEHIFCKCTEKYQKMQYFPNRDMYTVTVCDNLEISSTHQRNGKYDLIIHLDYDPLKLLYMCNISSRYSLFRQKELSSLKIILRDQHFYTEKDIIKYENIYIDYVMTCNPLYLKALILANAIFPDREHKDKCSEEKSAIDNINIYKNFYNELMNIEPKQKDLTDEIKTSISGLLSKTLKKRSDSLEIFLDAVEQIYSVLKTLLSSYSDFAQKHSLSPENLNTIYNEVILNIFECFRFAGYNKVKERLEKALGISLSDKKQIDRFFTSIDFKLNFYFDIALTLKLNERGIFLLGKEEYKQKLLKAPHLFDSDYSDFKQIISVLIDDCCELLYTKPDFNNNKHEFSIDNYLSFCKKKKSDDLYNSVEKYCNAMNWYKNGKNDKNHESYKAFSEKNLDYYSDLYVFEILGKKCIE